MRYGTTQRLVNNRTVLVAAAANESATNGSSAWWPPVASHSSSGYGCSVTNTLVNPAVSAARATSAIASALTNSSPKSTRSVERPTWNFMSPRCRRSVLRGSTTFGQRGVSSRPGAAPHVYPRRVTGIGARGVPELRLSGELATFRDRVRAFLRAEMDRMRRERRRDFRDLTGWAESAERELLERAGRAGLVGVSLPAEYGGGGRPRSWQAVVSFEAAAHDAPLIDTAAVLVAPSVIEFGSDEQRASFVPAAAAGTATACIAYTETGAGSDLARVVTTAVDDGAGRLRARRREGARDRRAQGRLVLHHRPYRSTVVGNTRPLDVPRRDGHAGGGGRTGPDGQRLDARHGPIRTRIGAGHGAARHA